MKAFKRVMATFLSVGMLLATGCPSAFPDDTRNQIADTCVRFSNQIKTNLENGRQELRDKQDKSEEEQNVLDLFNSIDLNSVHEKTLVRCGIRLAADCSEPEREALAKIQFSDPNQAKVQEELATISCLHEVNIGTLSEEGQLATKRSTGARAGCAIGCLLSFGIACIICHSQDVEGF